MLRFVRVDESAVVAAHNVEAIVKAGGLKRVIIYGSRGPVWQSEILDSQALDAEYHRVVGIFRQAERTVD